MMAATGCHRRASNNSPVAVAIPPAPPKLAPPPHVQPGPEPLPRIEPPPEPLPILEQASRAFDLGDYDEAQRDYEKYLQDNPEGPQGDNALFHLGLIFASRPSERQKSITTLKQLITEYPNSA